MYLTQHINSNIILSYCNLVNNMVTSHWSPHVTDCSGKMTVQ